MSENVCPEDDFYAYVNAAWLNTLKIPDDKSNFSKVDELELENDKKLFHVINSIKQKNSPSINEKKILYFYKSGINTLNNETGESQIINEIITKIDAVKRKSELGSLFAFFHKHLIDTGFYSFVNPDLESNTNKIWFYQGSLLLPNLLFYYSNKKKYLKLRNQYKAHIENCFSLLGYNKKEAVKISRRAFKIEKDIGISYKSHEDLANPNNINNQIGINKLNAICPLLAWSNYFAVLKVKQVDYIIVNNPDILIRLNELIEHHTLSYWKSFFKWKLINALSPFISKNTANANFNFFGKIMQGKVKMEVIEKRVLGNVNNALGFALGNIYCNTYFNKDIKSEVEEIVNLLLNAFEQRILKLSWMTRKTKLKALEKIRNIKFEIAYPKQVKNYDDFKVDDKSYVNNILNAWLFNFSEVKKQLNKQEDRTIWQLLPQYLNAMYYPTQNKVCIPLGLLQEPFYSRNYSDARNFGALGYIIAHEITHALDATGAQFDKEGKKKLWWNKNDLKAFNTHTNKLIKQINKIKLTDKIKANGPLVLNEVIADLGGVCIALDAFRKHDASDESIKEFFESCINITAQYIRKSAIAQKATSDTHLLASQRMNFVFKNMESFYQIYEVEPNHNMYLPKPKRTIIW